MAVVEVGVPLAMTTPSVIGKPRVRNNQRDDDSVDTQDSDFDRMVLRNAKKVGVAQYRASVKKATERLNAATESGTNAINTAADSLITANKESLKIIKQVSDTLDTTRKVVTDLERVITNTTVSIEQKIQHIDMAFRSAQRSFQSLDKSLGELAAAFGEIKRVPTIAFLFMVISMLCFAVFSVWEYRLVLQLGTAILGLVCGLYLCYTKVFPVK